MAKKKCCITCCHARRHLQTISVRRRGKLDFFDSREIYCTKLHRTMAGLEAWRERECEYHEPQNGGKKW